MGEGWDSGHDHLVPLLAGVVSWFLGLQSPYLVMHVSLVAHNITAWCPSVVLLQSLWKCQGCASRSWGARPGGTGTVRAEPACVCVSVVCIHNTHGCFFSLPPPLSLSLSLSPPHAAAGTRWARSPLRPLSAKAGFLQLRLFVCVFFLFFPLLRVPACRFHWQSHMLQPSWRGAPSPRPAKGSPGIQQLPAAAAGPGLQRSIRRAFDTEPVFSS